MTIYKQELIDILEEHGIANVEESNIKTLLVHVLSKFVDDKANERALEAIDKLTSSVENKKVNDPDLEIKAADLSLLEEDDPELNEEQKRLQTLMKVFMDNYGPYASQIAKRVLSVELSKDTDHDGIFNSYLSNISCLISEHMDDNGVDLDIDDCNELGTIILKSIFDLKV